MKGNGLKYSVIGVYFEDFFVKEKEIKEIEL